MRILLFSILLFSISFFLGPLVFVAPHQKMLCPLTIVTSSPCEVSHNGVSDLGKHLNLLQTFLSTTFEGSQILNILLIFFGAVIMTPILTRHLNFEANLAIKEKWKVRSINSLTALFNPILRGLASGRVARKDADLL